MQVRCMCESKLNCECAKDAVQVLGWLSQHGNGMYPAAPGQERNNYSA